VRPINRRIDAVAIVREPTGHRSFAKPSNMGRVLLCPHHTIQQE
jgi:hypothetical protein